MRDCRDSTAGKRTSLQIGMWDPRGLYRHRVTVLAAESYCHTGILQHHRTTPHQQPLVVTTGHFYHSYQARFAAAQAACVTSCTASFDDAAQ
jgi:hypothetical protein